MIYLGLGYDISIAPYLIYCFLLFVLNISVNVNLVAHLGGLISGMIAGYTKAMKEGLG